MASILHPAAQRPFVGVRFRCCGAYARLHKNKPGTAYVGHCPRCLRPVRLAIGPGGTDGRFFEVL